MSPRMFTAVIAAILLLAGGYGLLSTLTADRVDCGTAVAPNYLAGHRAECDAARDTRNVWAIPTALIGVVGLVGAGVVRRRPSAGKGTPA